MISQKARYAFRALIALSRKELGEAVVIGELARSEDIPQKFVEQILLDLKRSGLVASRRGKVGGYMLIKDPGEIFFGDLLRVIDGPVAPLPCLSKIAYESALIAKARSIARSAASSRRSRKLREWCSTVPRLAGNIQDIQKTYRISA